MTRSYVLLTILSISILIPTAPSAYADPPPWAPAHGWRKKHDPYYTGYSGKKWGDDYGIIEGKCNRDKIGMILGGAIGGAVGSTIGKGDGKTVAIIIGTVLGAVVGNRIGKELDKADRACIGHALELAADKRTVWWDNPHNGLTYHVTPVRGMTINGQKCREYDLKISGKGIDEKHREKACQTGDGIWGPM